jgi:prevent-host-death family protein
MPDTYIHKADAELAKLVERARAGDEVIVTTADDHKVRLVPVEMEASAGSREPRKLGQLRGKIWMADERLFYEGDKHPPDKP